MKRYILTGIIVMATCFGVSAQDYKWWIGGATTIWSEDLGTTVVVAPEIGRQLNSKFTIAASIGYHSYSAKGDSRYNDYSGFIFNPYVRYTAFKKGVLFGFVDGGVELGLDDFDGIKVGLKPGIAVAITNRFVVAMQFGFIGYNDGKGFASPVGRDEGFGIDFSGYQSGLAFFYCF